jgi:hypothetical protein
MASLYEDISRPQAAVERLSEFLLKHPAADDSVQLQRRLNSLKCLATDSCTPDHFRMLNLPPHAEVRPSFLDHWARCLVYIAAIPLQNSKHCPTLKAGCVHDAQSDGDKYFLHDSMLVSSTASPFTHE